MPLIICPECKASVSDKAPTCPQCGMPEPAKHIETLKAQQKAKHEQWQRKSAWQKYPEFLGFGVLVALAFLISIVFGVVSNLTDTGPKTHTTQDSLPNKTEYDEPTKEPLLDVDAISICDDLVRKRLNNPSSMATMDYDLKTSGYQATVERSFTAMNGFGAQLDYHYRCRIDLQNHTLVDLQVFQGGR